jgi:hypothetical protein
MLIETAEMWEVEELRVATTGFAGGIYQRKETVSWSSG